jgi:carbamate kinase
MTRTAVIAVGGNSLIRAGEKGTVAEQLANARRSAGGVVELIRTGLKVVVTHGNGPQVGAQLLRCERGSDQVPSQTLDLCGAATQGEIGYLLAQALRDELSLVGLNLPVATVITQTVVSPHDPAMRHPSKPIGRFYSRAEAEERRSSLGWRLVEDAARGYRRVVPSPEPVEIVELPIIRALVHEGMLVVACGGGGIPVVRAGAVLQGVEAVIDKDRASALLAGQVGADLFIMSTDTDCVYLNYKQPGQRPIPRATAAEMEEYYQAGQFPPGNMGPKIEAALRFLRAGGKEAIITSCERLVAAVTGNAGTHIVPDQNLLAAPLHPSTPKEGLPGTPLPERKAAALA